MARLASAMRSTVLMVIPRTLSALLCSSSLIQRRPVLGAARSTGRLFSSVGNNDGKSNDYQLEGNVIVIGDIQTFPSGFFKREIVVETSELYPSKIKLDLLKDKASLSDILNIGDRVNVNFNIRGNEAQGRFYISLNAWRIQVVEKASGDGGGYSPSYSAPSYSAPSYAATRNAADPFEASITTAGLGGAAAGAASSAAARYAKEDDEGIYSDDPKGDDDNVPF
ncbi:hypothetical protein M885DRAFT_505311 [Pelagophyceae sp. CCMP2097]|nr:hypothetical protein M885DRAFT_505311 [Pelagophyceae sp. CCMP2097]